MRRFLLSWMAVGLIGSMSGVTRGGVVRVDTNGTGNGSSWALASSLSNALANAQGGDALWIAQGVYTNSGDGVTSFVLSTNNLTLYGGFTNGMESLGDRDWTNYPTILDGANARRVLSINASESTIALDGLTLRNGRMAESPGGGGIRANLIGANNVLTLKNCRILNNVSATDARNGAGLYAANVKVTIDDCWFEGNTMYGRNDSRGGGIYLSDGSLTVRHTTFVSNGSGHHNQSLCGGGAGWILNATAAFTNCLFHGNSANSSVDPDNARGGALYLSVGADRVATLENCVLTANTGYQGGAIAVGKGVVNIRSCTIAGNDATGAGTQRGGALYMGGGTAGVADVGGGTANVTNTILWGNLAAEGKVVYCPGNANARFSYCNAEDVGLSCFQGNATVLNLLTNNPLFVTPHTDVHLRSTAGRWNPATASWTNDAVLSPCIDAGDPASVYTLEPPDNGGRLNLGAYGNTATASKSPSAAMPQVENRSPAAFQTMAVMRGELVAGTPSDIQIRYGTDTNDLRGSVWIPFRQTTGMVFGIAVGDLAPDVQYWYRCVVSNAAGVHSSEPLETFTTAAAPSGGADILHVDWNAASPVETGRDWCNAFKTVLAALAAVQGATNTLWIARGTYKDGGTAFIAASVNVYGGFTNGMTLLSQRDPSAHPTILDGENMRRIVSVTSNGAAVLLDGLTLQRGIAWESPGGGAILANRTGSGNALTLRNCRVLNNRGTAYASGGQEGAGIYARYVDVRIASCHFGTNSLHLLNNARGGALFVEYGSLVATDTDFRGNRSGHHNASLAGGGAGWILNAPAAFTNCGFYNNTADSSIQEMLRGGALYLAIGTARTGTLMNCQFIGNVCTRRGGAVATDGGTVNILSCSFTSNSITTTSDTSVGGAVHAAGGATVNLRDTILWQDISANGSEVYATNATTSVNASYSDLTGTNPPHAVSAGSATLTWGDGIISTNPLFASATDLHLKSPAGRWDPAAGSWTNDPRGSYSTCIDAGDPASSYSNEPYPNGHRVNLGAYGNTWQASKTFMLMGSVFIIK